MPRSARTRRIQRARKGGKTIEEIAAQEHIHPATVYRAIASPQFQKTLAVELAQAATRRLSNAQKADRIAEMVLDGRLAKLKAGKKQTYTPKDLADLGKFSHAQHEQGAAYLGEAIKRGQEQMDAQLKKDAQILEGRVTPLEKAVMSDTLAEAVIADALERTVADEIDADGTDVS